MNLKRRSAERAEVASAGSSLPGCNKSATAYEPLPNWKKATEVRLIEEISELLTLDQTWFVDMEILVFLAEVRLKKRLGEISELLTFDQTSFVDMEILVLLMTLDQTSFVDMEILVFLADILPKTSGVSQNPSRM